MTREIKITRNYLKNPLGSVLIETGETRVICTVTAEEGVPSFLLSADPPQGWLTAEYSMLPGAPDHRFRRERTQLSGRTAEIQRLIGRALRAVVDLTLVPGYTIYVDCDVIQADGGTRTAAITGSCVALFDAFQEMLARGMILSDPRREWVAAVSVGIVDGEMKLDLDYREDSRAEVDMNVVMTSSDKFVEIQGTAEGSVFSEEELHRMLALAKSGIKHLLACQQQAVGQTG